MRFATCRYLIKMDLMRFKCYAENRSIRLIFRLLMTNDSFRITFWFRLGTWLRQSSFSFLFPIVQLYYKHLQRQTGIQLPLGTQIGGGIHFFHFGTIVINKRAIVGENFSCFHNVTIGTDIGHGGGVARIGDNCVLSAGATLIGDLQIGNNVMVGASAVVTKNVLENSIVVGNPAHVISYNGKQTVAEYKYD